MNDDALRDLRNAMVVVLLDGKIDEGEKTFLNRLRQQVGIDPDRFSALVQEVRENPSRLDVPKGPQGERVLQQLIDAATSDNELSDRERKVLKKVADHVGLDDMRFEQLLALTQTADADESLEDAGAVDREVEALYANFAQWDDARRREQIDTIASTAADGILTILKLLESYRVPDGCEDNLHMKTLLVDWLGQQGDERAVYYLAQQVSLGDVEEEISNAALRAACSEAMGNITGQGFSRDDAGVENARAWWRRGQDRYNRLAF
jgi:hypothetical protein